MVRHDHWPGRLGMVVFGLCWFGWASPGALASDYAPGIHAGQITASNLAELSGIAASRQNPGVLWVHNDRARDQVFAVSTNGPLLATWSLGSDVSDFEDIAIGPGPRPDLEYLYCGDIGDNSSTRPNIRVYRAAEPAVYPYQASAPKTFQFPAVEKFTLIYPDGSHNAEALLVDPWTADVLIATKEARISRIYRAESSQLHDGAQAVLAFVIAVEMDIVSAGDIAPDGTEILLRQEDFARIWRRRVGQSFAEAMKGPPIEVPVIGTPIEPNGEGITFAADGAGYYTMSEGPRPPLYYFAKTNNLPVPTTRRLVGPASAWKYLDDGKEPPSAWTSPGFIDDDWKVGSAQFGYGESDEQTIVSFGEDPDRKFVTTYFRKVLEVPNPAVAQALVIRTVYGDGLAVYLNDVQLLRTNLAAGATFSEPALASASSEQNLWHTFSVPSVLRMGSNTLAVEVHRFSPGASGLSFDLQLLAKWSEPDLRFSGPPQALSGGGWSLQIEGRPNANVSVERSADLRQWSPLGSLFLNRGTGSITVPVTGDRFSFFRMRER